MIIDGSQTERPDGHRVRAQRIRQHPPRPGHRRLRRRRLGPQPHRRRRPDPGQLHRRVSRLSGRSDRPACLCRRRTRSSSPGWATRSKGWCWARRTRPWAAPIPRTATSSAATASQGVLIEPGASGNQVLGNQIGVVGPSSSGLLLPGRQRRRRSVDRVVGNRRQSVEHRLCLEQHDRRRRRGVGQPHLGQPRRRRPHRGRRVRRGTWSRPTTSARLPAAAMSSATASPATWPTACGSTTRPTTRSAASRRPTAT